ncbi:MAG TPA: tyrosine-type recombinase/integrase [Nitrososphaeraceae archaeon]|nr:tyrosine-type recombinase/integrase [Nitrososphaeraceae archaeon]
MTQVEEYFYTIKSEETKHTYAEYLRYFETFTRKSIIKVLKMDPAKIQDLLVKYVIDMRDKSLSSSSITGRLAPIFSILELNDVIVNKRRILKFVGERTRIVKDLAYTIEDIEKMVNISKPRTRLIILIYASTGIRRSALLELKLKHIEKIEELKLYKFTIYENSKEEYVTFCTPECAQAIDHYIELRKDAGENINGESWLIRNDFDIHNEYSVKHPKQTTGINIATILRNTLIKVGLRSLNQPQSMRNEKATTHGFRKFVTTQFVNSSLNPELREMLLGHKIGLAGVYYRPSDTDMINEYLKAVDRLTIDPTHRLKRKITVLEGREKEIESMKQKLLELEGKLQEFRMEKMLSIMDKKPIGRRELIDRMMKNDK